MQTQEDELKQALNDAAQQTNANYQDDAATATDDADKPLTIDELQSENIMLKNQLAQASEIAKTEQEKLIRALAEAENQRKRIEGDIDRERKFGNEKILKALLPVVDSLELAITHAGEQDAKSAMMEGVKNTLTLFMKELSNFGVKQLNPQGEPFDPNVHQAISMAENAQVKPGTVIYVMQKGYTLNDRVVRPAMVVVSKAPEGKNATEDGEVKNTINIQA